jgi:ATP-dependent helicase/nuclease subunit B
MIILLPTQFACSQLKTLLTQQQYKIYPISNLSDLIKLPTPQQILGNLGLTAKITDIILSMNLPKFKNFVTISPLAEYLGKLIQTAEIHNIDLSSIIQIINQDLSSHKQELLEITKNFIQLWQKESCITKAGYNNLLLNKLADNQKNKRLILAGISYCTPSIIKLISKTVENNNDVIFYGLNQDDWDILDAHHSQSNFKQIFSKLNILPSEVIHLGDNPENSLMSTVFKPWQACDDWHQKTVETNIKYLQCFDLHHEAKSIIKILKNESFNKALIVTADDQLMAKIILNLKAENITANIVRDYPLNQTISGTWLRLFLNIIDEKFSLLSVLSLLKHPLTNITPEILLQLESLIRNRNFYGNNIFDVIIEDEQFITILGILKEIKELSAKTTISFTEMLDHHLNFAQILAKEELEQELQDYLKQLKENASGFGIISPKHYSQIFNHFLQNAYYRPDTQNSSITLVKPIDARLDHADLIILAGLNDGIWPRNSDIDPCLNQELLKKMGFPPADQVIGEEAYNFQCLLNKQQVILSRAEKISSNITTPSRWLSRILILAGSKIDRINFIDEHHHHKIASQQFPCPPVDLRPKQLSVTQIDKLIYNPYHIYVDEVLKLRKKPNLAQELSALDFGIFIHRTLEIYQHKRKTSNFSMLLDAGKQALKELNLYNNHLNLIYWPRFVRIAQWFANNENTENITYVEAFGKLVIGDNFVLTARADRIEVCKDNSLYLTDYKTGRLSTSKAITEGRNLQLSLEGLIANKGGFFFQRGKVSSISSLAYIRLSGDEDIVEILEIDPKLIIEVEKYLTNLIEEYQKPETSYSYTKKSKNGYCEYNHLARVFY